MPFLEDALNRPGIRFPLQGHWKPEGFPAKVYLHGFPLHKAWWRQPYPGVVAQYREQCAHNSLHMKVLRNNAGRFWWIVDHADDFNPDRGPRHAIGHFFTDYEPGRIAKPAAVALTGLLLTRWLVAPVPLPLPL